MEFLPYKIIKSWGLNFRPHELNIILNSEGNDIFLYEYETEEKQERKSEDILFKKFEYDYPNVSIRNLFKYLKYRISKKIRK
jgi:hypothetical protein